MRQRFSTAISVLIGILIIFLSIIFALIQRP
jgi:hypothetical protein